MVRIKDPKFNELDKVLSVVSRVVGVLFITIGVTSVVEGITGLYAESSVWLWVVRVLCVLAGLGTISINLYPILRHIDAEGKKDDDASGNEVPFNMQRSWSTIATAIVVSIGLVGLNTATYWSSWRSDISPDDVFRYRVYLLLPASGTILYGIWMFGVVAMRLLGASRFKSVRE